MLELPPQYNLIERDFILSQQQDLTTVSDEPVGLTPKEELFLEVLFAEANGDMTLAMELAGFSKTTSKQQLASKLKEEILESSKTYLASSAPLAVMSIINVLNDPTHPGAKNRISASKEVLDRIGVVKEEKKTIDVNNRVMFVLPAKEEPQLLTIDVEPN